MKKVHFAPYAINKYYRVTHEVSQDINKIAVSFDNDGRTEEANELRQIMEKVCDINCDLEHNPDWTLQELKNNANTLKHAIDKFPEFESTEGEFTQYVTKLQGLYDCWQRIFNVDFKKEQIDEDAVITNPTFPEDQKEAA